MFTDANERNEIQGRRRHESSSRTRGSDSSNDKERRRHLVSSFSLPSLPCPSLFPVLLIFLHRFLLTTFVIPVGHLFTSSSSSLTDTFYFSSHSLCLDHPLNLVTSPSFLSSPTSFTSSSFPTKCVLSSFSFFCTNSILSFVLLSVSDIKVSWRETRRRVNGMGVSLTCNSLTTVTHKRIIPSFLSLSSHSQ